MLKNKLGLENSIDLMHEEERLSKQRVVELYEKNMLATHTPGTFQTLSFIHYQLFQDIYDFAGKLRTVNIAKGNFRFASLIYLAESLKQIEKMPQATFAEIVEKYVEMNIAHPFREGNGRSTRIWLDHIFKAEIAKCIDWSLVNKDDYLLAMERSPVRDIEIKYVLKQALTDKIRDRAIFMKGIDASYAYEGYDLCKIGD